MKRIETIKGADKPTTLTCCHCGHQSEDVENFTIYVGGQGNVVRAECVNQPDCLSRQGWDTENMRLKGEVDVHS